MFSQVLKIFLDNTNAFILYCTRGRYQLFFDKKGCEEVIGFIVTGHGDFSTGMQSAVEMIAGRQEFFETVVFKEDEALEAFEEKMVQKLQKLLLETESVIIFTDLLGGTPFRTAMLAVNGRPNVEVIAGTNLPLLIESTGVRFLHKEAKELLAEVLPIGKEGIVQGKLTLVAQIEQKSEEEGI